MKMKMKTVYPENITLVQKELGMTKDSIKADVAALKLWLDKQPHLGCITGVNENKWLEHYLTINKNSVERAKKNLDVYFSLRSTVPEVFQNRDADSPEMRKSFESTCIATSPHLTPDSYRVLVYGHFTDDPSAFNLHMIVTRLVAMMDIYLKDGVDRAGFHVVCDLKNSRFGHIAKYSLPFIKKVIDYCWKAYPERIGSIHIINPSPVSQAILTILLPFLTDKMRNRVFVHSNLAALYEHIPKTYLPSDYGGECPSMVQLNEAWLTTIKEHKDWLDITKSHRSNENLRTSDIKDTAGSDMYSIYGHAGSFRKLAVD